MNPLRVWRHRRRGLQRFRDAQEALTDPTYDQSYTWFEQAMLELQLGRKVNHWMWFVFPQAKGLGTSYNSRVYGLDENEARAYLEDEVLGGRLMLGMEYVAFHLRNGRTTEQVFGEIDAAKFRSCVRLFARVGLVARIRDSQFPALRQLQ